MPARDGPMGAVRARVLVENGRPYRSRFSSGDRVRIVRGPLQGLEDVFDWRLPPSRRTRILVNLLSELVPVEIHASVLALNGRLLPKDC